MSVPATVITENIRTATKARIKRGSALARQQMNRFDRESLARLDNIYRQAVVDLQQIILSHADPAGNLKLQTLQQLLNQSQQRLGQLNLVRDQLLNESLGTGASVGVQPFAGEFNDGILSRIADEAVQFTNNFIGADGLQLSDRVWRVNNHASQIVGDSINNAVIQGQGASEAANNFLSRGEAVPVDVSAKINAANAGAVANSVGRELMKSGSPRSNVLRLFRTEINRAHGEAYMMTGESHPEFAGWKFLLSPRHPEADICDMHAKANLHGLGPGVYPTRKRNPWPAHPNTLSYTEIVFIDEISEQDKSEKESRLEWLNKQPGGVQESVLNSRKKRAALQSGLLRENEIATPWEKLKSRYSRRGIDTDALKIRQDINRSLNTRRSPTGAAVSVSLEAVGYKAVSANVLDTIDRIHGDGVLPKIPIKRSTSTKFHGAYYSIQFSNRAVQIKISQHGTHKDLTLAHEIGHFIDQQGLPGDGFSSLSGNKLMQDWREAVHSSDAVNAISKITKGPSSVDIKGDKVFINKKYARYLLEDHEIWARSYAQYIATKSENTILKNQLQVLIDQRKNSAIDYGSQWNHDDFKPISDAIDRLFIETGWINEQ